MLPTAMQEERDIFLLDFTELEKQKADKDLFVGYNAMKWIEQEELEDFSGVRRFRNEVRSFFMSCLEYMKTSFPFEDTLIKAAATIDPTCRQTASMQSLLELVEQLPANVVPEREREQLCREFCSYQSDMDLPVFSPKDRVDQFWAEMGKITDGAGSLSYPMLLRLAKHVLLIPHSNAFCESLFSMVKKITTDQRSSLGRGKEGHAKDSAYMDTHEIRNTLCALIASKINIFKGRTCFEWTPSSDLFAKAKSATYKAI